MEEASPQGRIFEQFELEEGCWQVGSYFAMVHTQRNSTHISTILIVR